MTRRTGLLLGASAASALVVGALLARRTVPPPPPDHDGWFHPRIAIAIQAEPDAGRAPSALALATTEPAVLAAAETEGLALASILQAGAGVASEGDVTTKGLYETAAAYRDVADVLVRDLDELGRRPKIGEGPDFGNHPFRASWLRSAATRFELIGAVHRLDRHTGEAARTCGELRLVYRLAADPTDRPTTRLPMTLNVLFPRPAEARGCADAAHRWTSLPPGGKERARALAQLFATMSFDQIEVNVQNLHGPSLREDMDDHAEYVLRAFDAGPKKATPRHLFNTPRPDLDATARSRLLAFVRERFAAIDDGTWIVPDEFLAERVVSVTPRGSERPANRTFGELLGETDLAGLPYDRATLVASPRALLRRLDEGTCPGCHQTRAIAGFHLLGEERVRAPFNSLAVAGSPHFHEDLKWRASVLAYELDRATNPAGNGSAMPVRPFSSAGVNVGSYGTTCGLDEAAFRSWTCGPDLVCTKTSAGPADTGICVPRAEARRPGDACQTAFVIGRPGPDGDRVKPGPLQSCGDAGPDVQCSPNGFGFPGGLCSESCETLGDERGESICVDIPSSGYESECFFVPIPIEKCLETHKARRRVRRCDEERPCRPDFACVAVGGGQGGTRGACVPPYFVFQARVDGPMLDRP